MTVAEIIKEMEFELTKIDRAEKQMTNEDFYYTLAYYRDLLDELEPKLETVTNEKEFPQYFWNNIWWAIMQLHNDNKIKEKTIIAKTKADDKDYEIEIIVRRITNDTTSNSNRNYRR